MTAASRSSSAQTTSAAIRLITSQPSDHHAPSLKLGSRPRAKKRRSMSRKTTSAAASAAYGATPLRSTPPLLPEHLAEGLDRRVARVGLHALVVRLLLLRVGLRRF